MKKNLDDKEYNLILLVLKDKSFILSCLVIIFFAYILKRGLVPFVSKEYYGVLLLFVAYLAIVFMDWRDK